MADEKKALRAHEARAKRAQANVDSARIEFSKEVQAARLARDPVVRGRFAALAARARWRIHHNIAVRNIEKVRANRLRKQILGTQGRPKAVRWALGRVGVVEHPPFSNSGPFISDWIRHGGGEPGYAWCQYFCSAALTVGGGEQLMSGYTPQVVEWARARQHGLKIVSWSQAEQGDFLFYKFPGVSGDVCDHVGLYLSQSGDSVNAVEGNTSPTSGGSQNNGGGVFRKTRSKSLVAYIVRPTYLGDI